MEEIFAKIFSVNCPITSLHQKVKKKEVIYDNVFVRFAKISSLRYKRTNQNCIEDMNFYL